MSAPTTSTTSARDGQTGRCLRIIEQLCAHALDGVSNRELTAALGISPAAASRDIALLAELGSGPVLVCGDGAALLCERARRENLRLAPESSREQNALSVALCGYRRWSLGYAVTPDALSPVYLRKPQAEREREERMNKGENKE